MENSKLLTISIAAYNAEKLVGNAVNSCLFVSEQIRNKIEIIIVNDGSKDNTLGVAHELEKSWPDIIKVIDKKNGGYGSTINCSIKVASGKYFKLLDADDLYDTNELEDFVNYLEKAEYDLIITDFTECRPKDSTYVKGMPDWTSGEVLLSDIKTNLAMHATCFKTEILRECKLELSEKCLYTDTEFVLYPMCWVKKVAYLECDLYQYTLGEDGQSVSKESRIRNYKDAKNLVLRMLNYYKSNDTGKFDALVMEKLFCSYIFALQSIVMGDLSHKQEALEFDNYIKKNFKKLYYNKSSRLLKLFRVNRTIMYRIFRKRLLDA